MGINKRIISITLSLLMMITSISFSVYAQEGLDDNNVVNQSENTEFDNKNDSPENADPTTSEGTEGEGDGEGELDKPIESESPEDLDDENKEEQSEQNEDGNNENDDQNDPTDPNLEGSESIEWTEIEDNAVMLLADSIDVVETDGGYIIKDELLISGGVEGTDFIFENGVLKILSSNEMRLSNIDNQIAISDIRIIIPKENKDANLILDGINLTCSTNSPLTLEPSLDGGAGLTIVLADGSINNLESTAKHYPALRAGETTSLHIDDTVRNIDNHGVFITPVKGKIPSGITLSDGTLIVKDENDRLTLLDSENPGTLIATGTKTSAAAIGGGVSEAGGDICIDGGNIKATSDNRNSSAAVGSGAGAGIGGGMNADGGNITINGGNIEAHGAYHGAGIGGGYSSSSAASTHNIKLDPLSANPTERGGQSGNITINGGYTKSEGGEHGNGFGDGCAPHKQLEEYLVTINGGTLLAYKRSYELGNDLGGVNTDVIVTGGSFKASDFNSKDRNYAYDEHGNEVFMTQISLSSYEDIEPLSLVEHINVYYHGNSYVYGTPKCVDETKHLYFWLPKSSAGEFTNNEVKVELQMINKYGEVVGYNPFYIDEAKNNATLKQYVSFTISSDDFNPNDLIKRYDGLEIGEEFANVLANCNNGLGIPVDNPEGGYLNDPDHFTFKSQRQNDENDMENNFLPSDVGLYDISIISTQYSETSPFNESFWGHRADNGLVVEIIKADSKIYGLTLYVDNVIFDENYDKSIDYATKFKAVANVLRADNEAETCKTPTGYVSFLLTDKEGNIVNDKDGKPIEIGKAKLVSSDEKNDKAYASATLEFTASDFYKYLIDGKSFGIAPKYIGEYDDVKYVNYNKSESEEFIFVANVESNNIDTDGDGKPDINIDKDGDGNPDINIDIDGDRIPDINIDSDKDGKPDINIDTNNDNKPDINIDTDGKGEWKPSGQGGNSDNIRKPDTNIDTDGDGKPDSDSDRKPIDKNDDGKDDFWRPNTDVDTDGDGKPNYDTADPDKTTDIDTNGDGNPDINIDVDKDGIPDLNIDTDGDELPDLNIDIPGADGNVDYYPDINIDTDGTGTWKPSGQGGNSDNIWKPDTNIDIDGDGKGEIDSDRNPIDKDKDGVDDFWHPNIDSIINGKEFDTADPDVNIDTDGDGKPDINIDVDGDRIPDVNIDTDGNGIPDVNIDIDHDTKPDINIDTDGTGEWKPSGEGGNSDNIWKPDTNIDTDGDGKPDKDDSQKPVDNDKDGVDDNWKPNKEVENGDDKYETMIPNEDKDDKPSYRPDLPFDRDDNKDNDDKEYTTEEKSEACEDLLGKGWEYNEDIKACVYTLNPNVSIIPGTNTK